jgi:GNAT superfamily N-acetyltransferase
MKVIELDPMYEKKASEILAAAFYNYPVFEFYFPDEHRRTRYLSWYLGNVLHCAMHYGEVYTTTEISGVMMVLLPGHTEISIWEYIKNGFLRAPIYLGLKNYIRSMDCETFVGNTHTKIMNKRPHYYLWGLVADPQQQKKGVGSALMDILIGRADAEHLPIYLETHREINVAYYKKFGFDLILSDSIPKFDIPIWCMVREPL